MQRTICTPRSLAALLTVAVAALILLGCGGSSLPSANTAATSSGGSSGPATSTGSPTAGGILEGTINGAGATFPKPVYVEWIGAFMQADPGVTVNYQGVGSGAGIQQFTKGTVDFGASDAPMKEEEIAAAEKGPNANGAKVIHVPMVFGAVAIAYNLKGVETLKLDSDVLAGIYLGSLTKWNDPKIVALNPGVSLPDTTVQPVHRSDSSGTTNVFTSYMADVAADFKSGIGKGKEVKWPTGVGGKGNDGVAALVQQQDGGIGYVELSYAQQSNMPVAQLKNKSGQFVTPSLESTTAAASGAAIPEDLRFSVANTDSPQAYPIVSATWILAYAPMKDAAKSAILKAYLTWALQNGDDIAKQLGYAPLPPDLKQKALDKVAGIAQ